MVMRQEIFDYIRDGEELVEEPFRRLIEGRMLMAHPHEGFWACMDTFKEKQDLDDVYSRGNAPWAVWNGAGMKTKGNGHKSTVTMTRGAAAKELA